MKYIFIMVSIFVSLRICSQEIPRILEYQKNHYKAANQNWMITQDCEGYIYAANTKGVLIFNGMSWQLVKLPNKQIPRSIFTGADCNVYVGGYEFFGILDNSNRISPTFNSLAATLLQDSKQEIWNIFGNQESIIFQSFSNAYKFQNDEISKISLPGNVMLGTSINESFYLPKIEQGLYCIENLNVVEIPIAAQLPTKSLITAIVSGTKEKTLLLGTQYHGLFNLSDKLYSISNNLNERLKNERINKILRLSNGGFAIGTILHGLYIVDSTFNIIYHLNKENGLSNNTVLALYEDINKDLWVGLDKGINVVKLSKDEKYYYDKKGQLGSIFTSIVFNGSLYLGTNQGLFKQELNGTYSLIDQSQGQVWSLLEVDGNLLVGHNSGTYELKGAEFVKISDITGGWCMQAINCKKIIQSTYTGLIIIDKKEGHWNFSHRLENGDLLISKFQYRDKLLLGYHNNHGFCKLTIDENLLKINEKMTFSDLEEISLHDDLIPLSSDNYLKFIKEDDVYYFDTSSESYITCDTACLSYEEKALVAVLNKYKDLGNISNLTFANTNTYKDYLVMGTDDGYIKVSKRLNSEVEDTIALDYILINGKLAQVDLTALKPFENDISVQFKSLPTSVNGIVQYKLNNWDKKWYPLAENGRLDFRNLSEGTYILEVKGRTSKKRHVLQFSIQPRWYKSWPGLILYLTMTLLGIYLTRVYNLRKLKAQKLKLNEEQEKELESEIMKLENERLEHEIKYKSKMLVNSTMTLVQKNKMLSNLKELIKKESRKNNSENFARQKMYNLIDRNINSDNDWQIFEQNFAAVHEDFLQKLKKACPEITNGELKLAAYIKMNLQSKEIAPLLNISIRSVENKRYRLRKKLCLSHENNLKFYLSRL